MEQSGEEIVSGPKDAQQSTKIVPRLVNKSGHSSPHS